MNCFKDRTYCGFYIDCYESVNCSRPLTPEIIALAEKKGLPICQFSEKPECFKGMLKTGEDYPCGPCYLPLECSKCGTIITEENVNNEQCSTDCELCDYAACGKCPNCGEHWHCGGCL